MYAFLTLAIFAVAFTIIYQDKFDRLQVMLPAAASILISGVLLDTYSPRMALESIYFETLALIFGMSLISAVLSRSGAFAYIAERTITYSRGSGWLVVILLTLLTYLFSLVANNLATMVVMLPLSLTLCLRMGLNPVPVLIAEIVASNLGGASTMIGDFPNMIISTAASLRFLDFIGGMMVPALILLAALLLFLQSRKSQFVAHGNILGNAQNNPASVSTVLNPFLLKLGLGSLGTVLVLFIFADSIGLKPAHIALVAGLILLEVGQFRGKELITASGARDILFFACLFVMVGGLNAAGVLDVVAGFIEAVSGGSKLASILLLMWVSAVLTLFLNAGPSTAFFIPVAMNLYENFNEVIIWWALSLGVLAGSSAALTGATAGSLAASHLDNFLLDHPQLATLIKPRAGLNFKTYLQWGLPIMGLFLGISTLYITLTLY